MILVLLNLKGQDASFSQFYANRLATNPAWAGISSEERRVFINYRNQWPALNNSYTTYSASYDQFIEPVHGGVGFRVVNDNQGDGAISQLAFSAIYAYHLWVSRSLTISGGFEASFVQRAMNGTNFIFEDQLNFNGTGLSSGSEQYGKYRTDFPDFNIGFAAFYKNYYGGISGSHLLKPNQSFGSDPNAYLSRKITIFAGGYFPIYEHRLGKEVLQVSPNLVYIQQKNLSQINYGLESVLKNQFMVGFWIRQNLGIKLNSLIFSTGYVTNKYSFRYSYDLQLSSPEITLPILGTHEISMILTPDSGKKKKHKAIKCPKI
jgi:type IX secretion system PorP/SprF family membrane protein